MELRTLLATVPQPGRLEWIGLRRSRRGPVDVVTTTEAVAGIGLAGDRRVTPGREPDRRSERHVTLVQAEHLAAVGALLGRGPVDPVLLRRNLVVSGLNLRALDDRRFTIGDVVFEGTGECHPCSRMEEALGVGGFQAMRGHGGLTARIVTTGTLTVGDQVELQPPGEGPLGTITDG
jgi:MOSC domain-containing protein YiiM